MKGRVGGRGQLTKMTFEKVRLIVRKHSALLSNLYIKLKKSRKLDEMTTFSNLLEN